MFNLFKKKEDREIKGNIVQPASVRDTLFGNLSPDQWPMKNTGGHPWSMFVEARDQIIVTHNIEQAIKIYRQITETPGLESRHYLQAWHFLRKLKVQPPPEIAQKVYGVIVEVVVQAGAELVVGYADHTARNFHPSGSGTIWEAPNTSLNEKIDLLIQAGEEVAATVPTLKENFRPDAPTKLDVAQICVLTPSGIHHGIGNAELFYKDKMAGRILNATTNLLQSLNELEKTNRK